MPSFEEDFKTLTTTGPSQALPGAVLLAATTSSDLAYNQTFGYSSLEPEKAKPLTPDSIFWIASCTKLLTSLSALQLVEAGKISLDTPIGDILPEIANPDILENFNDDGSANLHKATKKIQLHHLLTHTSGLSYDFLSEEIMKWFKSKGVSQAELSSNDMKKAYDTPLLFEPGTKWTYGPGLDWAGILIARVSGEPNLQSYLRKNIWTALGIDVKSMAFRQKDLGLNEQETAERVVHLSLRKQGDQSIVPADSIRNRNPREDLGGGGILASPLAYLAVLRSLLRNDGKILKPETLSKYMLEPQLVDGKVGSSAHSGPGGLVQTLDNMLAAKMLTGGLPLPKEEGAHEYQHGRSFHLSSFHSQLLAVESVCQISLHAGIYLVWLISQYLSAYTHLPNPMKRRGVSQPPLPSTFSPFL